MKLHVFEYDDHVEVWLDPDDLHQQGLCVGHGNTVNEARDDAIGALAITIGRLTRLREQDVLQGPR